jgi:hypothetical protein
MDRDEGKRFGRGTPNRAAVDQLAGRPLVTVLAEMIRSALDWEAEQDQKTNAAEGVHERPLASEKECAP